jgi:hypothetical protein
MINNSTKKIVWESWNSLLDDQVEILRPKEVTPKDIEDVLSAEVGGELLFLEGPQPAVVHTPLGVYPIDSNFKPSDRWDCWMGHTNFGITLEMQDILRSQIDGIEALRILGRYTFFIGIAKCFEFKNVREDIDSRLCVYTEDEIISSKELKNTLDLMKEQFKDKNFWSIFVDPSGNIEYKVSDTNDFAYIRGVNQLIEKKKKNGGILLRGEYGD